MSGTLLIGAGGLAREVLAAGMVDVVGVLDDDPSLLGHDVAGVRVVGDIPAAADRGELLLVCIGPSAARRRVVRRLRDLGVDPERFTTFRADSSRIGASSSVGRGSILLEGAVVTADATIGTHVVVMPNCTITHDDVLDDFATLAAGVSLGGAVHIGEAAYLGMNASVRQKLSIGAEATIGMGAVVLDHIPQGQTWAGVPARQLGEHP